MLVNILKNISLLRFTLCFSYNQPGLINFKEKDHRTKVPLHHIMSRVCVSCSVVSDSLWPHGLLCPWNSPGKNTGVGCHSLLQIFPIQRSNLGLPHCKQILYHRSHQGGQYARLSAPLLNATILLCLHSSSLNSQIQSFSFLFSLLSCLFSC